ncbi:ABC transporter ATP-binding protein [uncultured Acetatifactor sp.]|uniref:ABC transporter ATP-binding protein n=1 Tax=uncultured Acetatifactor sp. TaxID=1671927 RepID=UPI002602484D|nr:ABC transporter ATP-binding protein [uncultured Acetatifactor sp.]
MKNKKNRRSLITDIGLILRGYRVLYEVCPQNIIWATINAVAQQFAPYFTLFLSAELINRLMAGASLRVLLLLALATVTGQLLLNVAMHLLSQKAEETRSINFNLNELYMLKVGCRMQYKHLEDPDTALLRQQIRNFSNFGGNGLSRLYWCYQSLLSAMVNIIFSVSLTMSLFRTVSHGNLTGFLAFVNHPLSALVLLALIGLNIGAEIISIYRLEPKRTKLWSSFSLRFSRCLWYAELHSDAIVLGAAKLCIERCRQTLVDFDKECLRKNFNIAAKRSGISRAMETVTNLALYLYIGAKAYIGTFGVGNFFLYTGTVERFLRAVSDFGSSLSQLRQNNDYLLELYRYLDLPDEMYHGTLSVEKREDNKFEIEFRNVSFRYPGSDTYALKNVSFKFRVGERLAFVGMNGSGKTTFVKLLCRLYDPTEGQILLKGIDISKYNYDEYVRLFSVVFQDYFTFDFSLGENVSAKQDYDADKVWSCLKKIGIEEKFAQMERGLETPLGTGYQNDGVEISGGEKQKVALARALYKDSPYIILDEPTAALDPIAEAEVYSKFNEIVGDKTAIYISHRLSSCRLADKILVFHQGEIIQQGSHEQLVADAAGKYHELWNAQAQYYT